MTRMGLVVTLCAQNVMNAVPTGTWREAVPILLSPTSLTMKALSFSLPSWQCGVSICM